MVSDIAKGFQGNFVATFLFVFTLAQSWFTTGIVFGWPCLLLLLKNEGVYLHKCPPGVTECSDRDVALNLVFTLGAVANVLGGVFAGPIGSPKIALGLGVLLSATGSLIFALSPTESQVAWPIGFVLHGIAGGLVHLPSFSLGNAFGSAKGMVIATLVACFCASALTFQIMHMLYEGGLSRQTVFLMHTVIELVNSCVSFWFWPSCPLKPGDKLRLSGCRMHLDRPNSEGAVAQTGAPKTAPIRVVVKAAMTKIFISFMFFHTSQLWFNRCLMGWFHDELITKDKLITEAGGSALNIDRHMAYFTSTQALLGLPVIPVFGWLVARYGHRTAPFVVTGFLSVIWLVCVLIPQEWPLYILYVTSSWHRQFFFSSFFNFMSSEFTPEVFAKLAGVANFIAGLASGTQNPLLNLTFNQFDGSFVPINTCMLTLATVLEIGACFAFCRDQKSRKAAATKLPDEASSKAIANNNCESENDTNVGAEDVDSQTESSAVKV
mmetsp:Transcript_58864/g.129215  ORF Transcript_58864/g.129215 Transcript_58864/m.129215 type:complete len:493 (-) Transcript_58864:351-1829(-)